MDLYEAIHTRKTIRDFKDQSIPAEILEKIIDAGMQAPSNNHLREWEFIVISDSKPKHDLIRFIHELNQPKEIDALLDEWKMTDLLQRSMYQDGIPKQQSMILNAAVDILPCFRVTSPLLQPGCLSDLNYFASIWCCIENMLLAASAEGIFGVTRIPFDEERAGLKELLGVPDDYEIPCYLSLGYPRSDARRQKQVSYDLKKKIHTNRW